MPFTNAEIKKTEEQWDEAGKELGLTKRMLTYAYIYLEALIGEPLALKVVPSGKSFLEEWDEKFLKK